MYNWIEKSKYSINEANISIKEEITFGKINMTLRNKNLIGIFTILSIFISSLLAYNQRLTIKENIF